jgi:hypothetical protein
MTDAPFAAIAIALAAPMPAAAPVTTATLPPSRRDDSSMALPHAPIQKAKTSTY